MLLPSYFLVYLSKLDISFMIFIDAWWNYQCAHFGAQVWVWFTKATKMDRPKKVSWWNAISWTTKMSSKNNQFLSLDNHPLFREIHILPPFFFCHVSLTGKRCLTIGLMMTKLEWPSMFEEYVLLFLFFIKHEF